MGIPQKMASSVVIRAYERVGTTKTYIDWSTVSDIVVTMRQCGRDSVDISSAVGSDPTDLIATITYAQAMNIVAGPAVHLQAYWTDGGTTRHTSVMEVNADEIIREAGYDGD